MVSSPPLPSKGNAFSSNSNTGNMTHLALPPIMEGSNEVEFSTSWKNCRNETFGTKAKDDLENTLSRPELDHSESMLDIAPQEETSSELETAEDWIQEYLLLQRRKASMGTSSSSSATTGIFSLFHHATELDRDLEYILAASKARQKKRQSFQSIINGDEEDDVSTVAPVLCQTTPKSNNLTREIHWLPPQFRRNPKDSGDLTWEDFMSKRAGLESRPYWSYVLTLVCLALLIFSFYKNDWKIEPWSTNSAIGPAPEVLVELGGLVTKKLLGNVEEWYRIFMAMILHGGILHLLGNVVAIFFVGPPLEREYGWFVMGATFVVAGAAANLCSAVFSPWGLSVGASGGICSWLGIALSKGVSHWPIFCALHGSDMKLYSVSQNRDNANDAPNTVYFSFLATKLVILFELMILALIGLLPWIDQFAHLGGLFFGFVFGIFLFQPSNASSTFLRLVDAAATKKKIENIKRCIDSRWFCVAISRRLFRWILFCGAVALCATNMLWLYRSEEIRDLPCHNCRYLNCAPFTTSLSKQCDPCNYIQIEYVIKGSYQIANITAENENDEPNDVAYIIETKCPYGETVTYISPTSPMDRGDWMEHCHHHCEL